MFTNLSLRFRVFLFFCLVAFVSAALAAGALAFGWSRGEAGLPAAPFLTAFIAFTFLNTGFALGIWLLFDENMAKPITRLSADLRLRAHSGVDCAVDTEAARYLGDLAPAASALSETMSSSVMDTAAEVARETERLKAESARLTALLTEIPIATILLNPAREIVLYDAQAADVLSQIAPPRLKAPLADYFDLGPLHEAMDTLSKGAGEVTFTLQDTAGNGDFNARLKALGGDGHMLCLDVKTVKSPSIDPRPLVFDFDLMNASETKEIKEMPLRDLCFVPFDTETTGLSVEKDAIVQLGAVRVLNGRIVEGEVLDTYVNPGRAIPPASTKIHGVTDADVAAAPDIGTAGRSFHHFARDAVLVAHNAPFDIGLLRRFQSDMEVEWNHPVLDTVLLSAVVFGTNEEHSLDALCDRLAVTLPAHLRHTALGDAQATAQALVKLLPLLEGKGVRTFGNLLEATQKHGRLLQDMNG
ncbi:PolC-type DNA polymerase III [uncultured Roseobacter sp.]|uniref:3'-5' exonuclease n=1 Tax=uncultured Roseobacter sp. TaxID=114847 RepID=UPI002610818B|nr:3'-5' exonuclease [uncultured Roseobacter sp.]